MHLQVFFFDDDDDEALVYKCDCLCYQKQICTSVVREKEEEEEEEKRTKLDWSLPNRLTLRPLWSFSSWAPFCGE